MKSTPPPIKLAHRAVGVMFCANGILYASWVSRIPAARDALAIGEKKLGLVLLGAAIGALLAFRVAGRLIARFSSRTVTWVAASALCFALPLLGFMTSVVTLTMTLVLVGAASGLMDVGMNAHGVEVEKRLGRPIFSSLHGIFSLGGLVGAALGALVAGHGISMRTHLVAVSAALLAVVLHGGRRLLREDMPVRVEVSAEEAEEHARTARLSGRTLEPSPSARSEATTALLGLGAIAFCSSLGEGAMADWTGIYLQDVLHSTAGIAALGYAAYSLAMLTGRFAGDRITARLGEQRVVRTAGLFVTIGLSCALAIPVRLFFFAGVIATGLGLSVLVPVVFRAAGRLPGLAPGAALARIATLSYGGFLIGPPAIGFLAEHFSLRIGLASIVVLASGIVIFSRAAAPRELPAPTATPLPQRQ
ncbi:major facilitator superfamily MFS_1 [Labilithrix luteola]|uniref:Major facilitator superfamily MFS_1 n=1 Tax=Labilithrix luteola TaxID=1391654 RepID=A0A0K1PTU0_9BACT|nr:MFS transporter [Labilithrix luteola]AKU96950.1 major facilitator superfamily MFS_1 [Labilithrix luteola]